MGNNHGSGSKSGESTPTSNGSRKNTVTRTASNPGPSTSNNRQEGHQQKDKPSQLVPLERLVKILVEKSQKEENSNEITLSIFKKYLFPRYPVLAERFFNYLNQNSNSKKGRINTQHFKQQCEKYLTILDDDEIRQTFVRMFASSDTITPDDLRQLLMCAYHVSMDHYSEGPQMCLAINKTLKAVVDSCFHTKAQLSVMFVTHWLETNCPRLLFPLHRYAVHSLATSYRTLEEAPTHAAGLELATPVLEHPAPFPQKDGKHYPHLLQMSMSWLLAGALSPLYSRPQKAHSPNSSGANISSYAFLSKLLCSVPSHWVNLYDSNEMGLGANRFLHHVMAYKGATLCLLQVEDGQIFCIACPMEWKDTHVYWGGPDSAVFQMFPKFQLLEKGSKLLYLNTTCRGYPYGLRAGTDPRQPIISIDGGFEKCEFKKIPYNLSRIEVWGCGDAASRENQLAVKNWEVKEAERQRFVKISAADWLDHPDRYLLELAGRPQYHQNQT